MARILLIDDEEGIRTLLKVMLEQDGHAVDVLEDGRRAVPMHQEHHYDLVITDIFMPEEEGLETIRKLKKVSPDLKLIAMSGGGDIPYGGGLKVARLMGADHVFFKPIPRKELLEQVARLTTPEQPGE